MGARSEVDRVLAPEAGRPLCALQVKDRTPDGFVIEQKAAAVAEAGLGVVAADPADEFTFTIIGSVTGVVDEVKDIILPGAYAATLRKRTPKVIKGHDWGQPLGKVLEIQELPPGDSRLPATTSRGDAWPAEAGALLAKVRLFGGTAEGRDAAERWREYGAEQEFSIGYVVPPGGATKDARGVRRIKTLDCYEISDVLWGAMPLAGPLPANLQAKMLAGLQDKDAGVMVLEDGTVDEDGEDLDAEPGPLERALHEAGMPEVDWREVTLAAEAVPSGTGLLLLEAEMLTSGTEGKARKGTAPKTFGATAKPKKSGEDDSNSLPDGSFPIATKADLVKAVKGYFLAKDRAAAKRHIISRARALDALDALPKGWVKEGKDLGLVMEGKAAGCRYCDRRAQVGLVLESDESVLATCSEHEARARDAVEDDADEVLEVLDLTVGALVGAGEAEVKALVLLPGLDLEVKRKDLTPGDGNAANLKRWYEVGEGAAKIRWGTDGDLTRCQRIARKHMLPDQAWGFCNLRHRAVLGTWNDSGGKALPYQRAVLGADGVPLVPGYRPSAERGVFAGDERGFAGAAPVEDVIEGKGLYGVLPGSYEERRDRLHKAVKESLQGERREASGGRGDEVPRHEWDYVDVVATWDDRVIAHRVRWEPEEGQPGEQTFEIAYSVDEAGEVTLGEPDEVRLEVTVVGQGPGDGSEVPPLDAVAPPVADLVSAAAVQAKMLMDPPGARRLEGKAGRVLSGMNEGRLRAAVEHLVAVLRASGMRIALADEAEAGTQGDALTPSDTTSEVARTPAGEPAEAKAHPAGAALDAVDVSPDMVVASIEAFLQGVPD